MRSKSGPGGTLYHYGLCELAQRQAVLLRQDKTSDRAIKSDRAKVAMTAGCISRTFDISNYIYIHREIGNSANQNLYAIDWDVSEMYSRAVLIDINGLDMLCYMSQTMKKFA